jgi:hypothetical protein
MCSTSVFFRSNWFCNRKCTHDSGDRTACTGWDCGCTRYSKMRRMLRKHRVNMRIMQDLLESYGHEDELEACLIEETGNTQFFLDVNTEMDESSDAPDPEAELREEVRALRQEAADRQAFVIASQGMATRNMIATPIQVGT